MSEEIEETEEREETPEEVEEERELSMGEIIGGPQIVCPEDYRIMEVEDSELREIEKRKFLFSTTTESHLHLKYVCPECGRYYFHDVERKRQGCFIATAAYGTPLAKEINVLRKFRDSYLVHKGWGRKLVSSYYAISPPIAKTIEKSNSLKKLVRTCLIPILNLLKERDSPN